MNGRKGRPSYVTALVQEWIGGRHQNQGMFLRTVEGGASHFRSRQYDDRLQRPQLIVSVDNREIALAPVADTYLDQSTYRSLGDRPVLRVAAESNNALHGHWGRVQAHLKSHPRAFT